MSKRVTEKDFNDAQKLATASSTDLVNLIRANSSQLYRDTVPKATGSSASLREIGSCVTSYEPVYNEFLDILNRIAFTIVKNAAFTNPLYMFDNGVLDYGETIREIFVKLAEPHQFDELEKEEEWHMLKTEKANIDEVFHYLNYQIYYKQTIDMPRVKQAFLSESGVREIIDFIIQSMYKAQVYDTYAMTMYMIAKRAIEGNMTYLYADSNDKTKYMGKLRGLTNTLSLPTREYNDAHVINPTRFDEQIAIVSAWFEGELDAESLAYAFHQDKIDYQQKRVIVNSFSEIDIDRINELLSTIKGQKTRVTPFTKEEIEFLDGIKTFIVSSKYLMIYTNDIELTNFFDGERRVWNYWLHDWKTFATSPYESRVAVVSKKPVVSGITITPDSVDINISEGGTNTSTAIQAVVTADIGASKDVGWYVGENISDSENENFTLTKINADDSIITLKYSGVIENRDVNLTAYSMFNPEVKKTVTVHLIVS